MNMITPEGDCLSAVLHNRYSKVSLQVFVQLDYGN